MSQLLLSFKAGRANRREGSNFVDPNHTKGLVEISKGLDDELLHFQWKDRTTGQIEDDLIIFPSEAQFLKAAGRTYVLKFSSSSQRHFFWMQDLSPHGDNEVVTHVNGYLADPDYQQTSYIPPVAPIDSSGASSSAHPAATPGFTEEQLDQLRAMVTQAAGAQTSLEPPELSLTDVLTPANLEPLFSNPTLVQAVFPQLPADLPMTSPPTEETLQRVIESPQFHAALRNLDQALSTGLLGEFVKGLGLPEEAGLGVGPFLKAIAEQAKKDPESPSEGMETD